MRNERERTGERARALAPSSFTTAHILFGLHFAALLNGINKQKKIYKSLM